MNWFIAYTNSKAELKAVYHLERQGYEVYLPCYLKKRRHARRVDWISSPMFPRYLFVGLDTEKMGLKPVSSTVGISHLVTFGGRPVTVPLKIINSLKALEDEKGLISIQANRQFRLGDKVEILNSAFGEVAGYFESLDDRGRVTLLLDLMGRQTKVKTSLENIGATI